MSFYDSDSYRSGYMPQKSIYQSDMRIFHLGGLEYDTVSSIADASFEANTLKVRCILQSGATAWLTITPTTKDIARLRFWEGEASFEDESVMVVPQTTPAPDARFHEYPDAYDLRFDNVVIRLERDPFTLRVAVGHQVVLELETERLAGDFVTPPLGFRRSEHEALPYLSWRIHNADRFFGLGEKWNKVEKSSTRATIWASDTCGSNTTDMSYKSVPVLFCTTGWGLMLHSSFRSFWEIGTFSYTAGSLLTEDPKLDLFLILAPDLRALLQRYTQLTGRPQMPPRWAFGVWMSRCQYQNRAQVEEVLERLRAEEIPCDVVHLDPQWMATHYYYQIGVDACDFEWNVGAWPEHEQMLAHWREQGFHTCFWVNPYLPEGTPIYAEAEHNGYLARRVDGGLARLEHGNPVGTVDFTNPDAYAWWKGKLKDLAAQGAAVFKPDYGDRVAEDALFHNGKTGREMHNLYLFLYTRAAFEAAQEANGDNIVWRRAGYIGSQRYPGTWAGDTQVSWEGMRGALRGGLSAGLTGEAFWSHDIGGFTGPPPSPELYIRWAQFGLLSPLSRFHGTTPREPWEFGDMALDITRHYAQLRYQLIPYLLAAAHESCGLGLPMMRHLRLEFPDEPCTERLDEQYMLGRDLLVAPILQPDVRVRPVYLPRGRWWLLETETATALHGPAFHDLAAPLDRVPVLVREGAVLPRYDEAPPHLKVPAVEHMRLDIYPGAADRWVTFEEGEHTIAIRYQSNGAGGRLSISEVPIRFTVRLVDWVAEEVSPNVEWHTEANLTIIEVDATGGVDLKFG